MSALHQAVARAIAEVRHEVTKEAQARMGISMPIKTLQCDRDMAAAAVRVVLAEAQRAVEALPATNALDGIEAHLARNRALAEAWAALAALGDEA